MTGPTADGKFIWCQDGPTGSWVFEQDHDAKNYLGIGAVVGPTGITGGIGPVETTQRQLPGMERLPVEGDEWTDAEGSQFVYQNCEWIDPDCQQIVNMSTSMQRAS